MKVFNILNALFVRVKNNGYKYFLLDSQGISFSPLYSRITSDDIDAEVDFSIPLNSHAPIDLDRASKFFGIPIVGFLGKDFFSKFDNILYNIRGKELLFNISEFQAEKIISFYTQAKFGIYSSQKNFIIDTGSFTCLNFNCINYNGPKTPEFIFPSVQNDLHIKFTMMPLEINGFNYGEFFTGLPINSPPLQFHVIGTNFIENYELLIDNKNYKYLLKTSNKPQVFPTKPEYTFRFQIEMIDHQIIVSNVLDGCPLKIKKGDKVFLENLDLDDPEVMNNIYKELIFKTDNKPVRMYINDTLGEFTPVPLYE